MAKKKKTEKNVDLGNHDFFPEFPPGEYTEIPTYQEGIEYKFDDLPEAVKERLLKLQNEEGEHLRFERSSNRTPIGKALLVFVVLLLVTILCTASGGFNSYLFGLLYFSAFFLTVNYVVKHYEIKNSRLKRLYLFTPTQFIETTYNSVKFWGLHQINKIYTRAVTDEWSSLYIVLNGPDEIPAEDYDYEKDFLPGTKNYLSEPIELPQTKVPETFEKLKFWCEEYKKALEAENFNSIIVQNIFYEIPNLKEKNVSKPLNLRFNLLAQLAFSAFVTLSLTAGLSWLINIYEDNAKKAQLNRELYWRNKIYEKTILDARKKQRLRDDPQFVEYIIGMLENAKLNNDPKVYLLIEGENTISDSLIKRLQEKVGQEKLIHFPKNIAEGNFTKDEDKNTLRDIDSIFKKAFKDKELVIEPLESRHKKIDLTKESMITFKYKLEMKDELPSRSADVKTDSKNPQTVKVYYPELMVSVEVRLEVPNKPPYIVNLNTKPGYQTKPPGWLDGTSFYLLELSTSFLAAKYDFEKRFGLLITKLGDLS